jgi:hypothetical protein
MITTAPKTFLETMKGLVGSPAALAIFAALYALLLGTLYWFIATREATVWQVMITFFFMALIPAEFFILQAAIVDHARVGKFSWKQIVLDAIKLFVATIPSILIGWLLWYLLNKWQVHYPATKVPFALPPAKPPVPPQHWPTLLFATARGLLFGLALPLLTIHLWIEVAGTEVRALFAGGAAPFFKRIGNACARAFSSDSVLIYALGLIVFFAIPYAVLFKQITIKGNKTEFVFFILRLVLVFVFTLIGWVITIATLTRNAPQAPEARQSVAPGVSPGKPALENT